MKLSSCDDCGVVLDLDKIPFPTSLYTEEGIDDTKAGYNQNKGEYCAYIRCPVCDRVIYEE